MIRRPPRSTRTDTLFPYTTLFRSISKPMSEEAYRLLSTAPRREGCPYVLPSPNDPTKHLTFGEHYGGWCRVLKAAGVPHAGTHGIRHRSTTDIANSGMPTKGRSEERRGGQEVGQYVESGGVAGS